MRVSCLFSSESVAWARRTVARFIRKALIGSLCLNDNEDICRNSGHRFRPTGPYSDIWKQISGDQNTRALTLARRGVKPWSEEGFAGWEEEPLRYEQVPTGHRSQRSRICNQQQVALNPPLPSPPVTPRLIPDAGAVPPVWTRVSVVISVMEGSGGGVRVEQREGCKLSSRVLAFAERCSTRSLIQPHVSGLASSIL